MVALKVLLSVGIIAVFFVGALVVLFVGGIREVVSKMAQNHGIPGFFAGVIIAVLSAPFTLPAAFLGAGKLTLMQLRYSSHRAELERRLSLEQQRQGQDF